jgi:hypothetical protein
MIVQMKFRLCLLLTLATCVAAAQENPPANTDSLAKDLKGVRNDVNEARKLKVTGWIQAQFQYIETRGAANFDGGTFAPNSDKRFMIRRGRVKFTYDGKNSQYVMQLNGTERGLNLTEIFAVATDPWTKSFSVVCGVMNRPFGFEIDQSSAVRESPERSRYTQILMPNERDMGAKIVYAPVKGKKLYGLRLDAGFYNGQGVYVPGTATGTLFIPSGNAGPLLGTTPVFGVNEFDYQKDFIGRLSYYKDLNDKIKIGIGASHYNGGILYVNNVSYDQITTNAAGVKEWKAADTTTSGFKGRTAARIYTGGEAFFSFKTGLGTTTLRGEYIMGTQPGTRGSTSSPFFDNQLGSTYIRKFDGAYAYFIQRFGKSKHELAIKYEWYDPNTQVTGRDIFNGGSFTAADIRYEQLGLNYTYYMYDNVKFLLSYNIIRNEATGLSGSSTVNDFTKDIPDNVLTVRMHYRF